MTGDDWAPAPSIPFDAEAVAHLAKVYGFSYDVPLFQLLESVRLRGSRDDAEDWTPKGFQSRRLSALTQLNRIIEQVKALLLPIEEIRQSITDFEELTGYAPHLLQQIAFVDEGTELTPPLGILCLPETANQFSPNGEVYRNLQRIIDLPVREERVRGRTPNWPLQACVRAIRSYWREQGQTWLAEGLSDELVRVGNEPKYLLGDCERFTCDTLRLAGIDHNLRDLSSAMNKAGESGL